MPRFGISVVRSVGRPCTAASSAGRNTGRLTGRGAGSPSSNPGGTAETRTCSLFLPRGIITPASYVPPGGWGQATMVARRKDSSTSRTGKGAGGGKAKAKGGGWEPPGGGWGQATMAKAPRMPPALASSSPPSTVVNVTASSSTAVPPSGTTGTNWQNKVHRYCKKKPKTFLHWLFGTRVASRTRTTRTVQYRYHTPGRGRRDEY